MSENTPTSAEDVVEALGKVLDIIDESYRKYDYDWEGEDARAFQRARDLHQAALAAKPDQPAPDGLAGELGHLLDINDVDDREPDGALEMPIELLKRIQTDLSSNADRIAQLEAEVARLSSPTFNLGDRVRKKSGSEWEGIVVGFYKTSLNPDGVCVESEAHAGSVQIYPAAALQETGDGQV